jgi:transposase
LFERATQEPFVHVARGEGVSTYRVIEAFEALAERELAEPADPPRVLSIDESAFRRRFRYHTVISDPERGVVLDVFEGRGKDTTVAWLRGASELLTGHLEAVVMDMFWPYRQAVEAAFPGMRIVVDKFHVLRAVSEAAQKVRRRFGRRPPYRRLGREGGSNRQHHPASDPEVFRARWVFMKRAARLTDAERGWLESVFDRSEPEVRAAWLTKEAFAQIYDAPARMEAERRLDVWVDNLEAAGLREFTQLWYTLKFWREQILAYFDEPVTNGFAEGITNKIKVMKRTAYGFRSAERYRRKVLLQTGHRRVRPASTHRFSR